MARKENSQEARLASIKECLDIPGGVLVDAFGSNAGETIITALSALPEMHIEEGVFESYLQFLSLVRRTRGIEVNNITSFKILGWIYLGTSIINANFMPRWERGKCKQILFRVFFFSKDCDELRTAGQEQKYEGLRVSLDQYKNSFFDRLAQEIITIDPNFDAFCP